MLEIKKLSVLYGKKRLLFGDICFPFGKITALIGPSGSGKTTILNIIAGLNNIGSYEKYSIDDVLVSNMSQKEKKKFLNQMIFYIDQDSQLLNSMTCLDQLKLQQKLSIEESKYTIDDILSIVQLDIDQKTKVSQLSNGERQRLMIALALARNSSIILCDESTSSLDHENKENILKILKRLAYQLNKMIIIVSHDDYIYENCDCVYEINNGKISLKTFDGEQKALKKEARLLKNTDPSILNHMIKSRFQKNKFQYLMSCFIIAFMVVLLIMGKQASTQYSRHVKVAQDAISKNQIYLVHYGIDHTLLDSYQENFMPFDDEMVEFVKNNKRIDAAYPLYYFNIGRFLDIDYENPDSSSCSFEVIQDNEIKKLSLNKNSLNNYIFSYYPEDMIENSCEYYNSEVEGIILDYQIAKILGIENIDHLSIKMTVYIPVALKHDIGQITASDGMTYEIEFGNSIYTPVEMNLPVKGILSKAHINLSECFGYMDYQAMQKLFFDHAKQYHLQDDEYSWASNTYSIYVQKDNVEALYSELTECSNNYGLQSMQKSIADLMAPWTSLEKPFKIYTLCLASLAFILTIVYGFVKNKSEKREIALLNRWGISKTNLIKMLLYEIVLSFITVACFSLVGLFIGFQIGLSQGWFIRGFDFSVAMKENYLISVVLSLSLVFLSYLSCLVSVQRKYYD